MSDVLEAACPQCGAEVLDIDVKCDQCGAALASTGAQRLVGTTVLEHYEVTDVLGQGGMSVVYKARHKLTEQPVALKILTQELAAHNQVKSRFVDEAKALARLDHPNIVHLYNFGQEGGGFALAMQYVEGATWERLILEDAALDWRRSVAIAIDVLNALEYAHARGIVHRDMKPSNVLVRASDGTATVMDFGIAKMTTSTRLTATGQTMGTVRYMSPEQVRGQSVDARTDIYSLACTLYESLMGDTPFDGETHFEIMTKHLSEPPPSLRRQGVECPAALERVVLRGLAKQADDRPQTATEFRELIEACLTDDADASVDRMLPRQLARAAYDADGVETRPMDASSGPSVSKSRLALWGGLGATVAIVAAVAIVAFRSDGSSEQSAPAPAATAENTPPAEAWPDVYLPHDQLVFEVDETFDADGVRVLSEGTIDPEQVRDAYARATQDFTRLLRERKVTGSIGRHPLNVVLLATQGQLCDRRVWRPETVPRDCRERDFHYRPHERTLFHLAGDMKLITRNVRRVQAVSICIHSPDIKKGCDPAIRAFGDLPAN